MVRVSLQLLSAGVPVLALHGYYHCISVSRRNHACTLTLQGLPLNAFEADGPLSGLHQWGHLQSKCSRLLHGRLATLIEVSCCCPCASGHLQLLCNSLAPISNNLLHPRLQRPTICCNHGCKGQQPAATTAAKAQQVALTT